jgi:hypothetical protein
VLTTCRTDLITSDVLKIEPFERTVAALDKALRIIASEPIFWAGY